MKKLLKRAHTHAGLISVVGALILFFSWVVSNTIKDEAAAARVTYEHALEHSETDAMLQQIQAAVYYPDYPNPPDLKADMPRQERLRKRYQWAMYGSHAVRSLASNMIRLEHMTRSLDGTKLRSDMEDFVRKVRALDGPLRKLAEAASEYAMRMPNPGMELTDEEFKRGSEAMDALEKHIAELDSGTRVQDLSKDADSLQLRAIGELHFSAQSAEQRAKTAKWWAIALYVVGSIVALFGQTLDKGKFFEEETVTTTESPSKQVAKKAKQR
jgi:hypothetical protein